MRWITGENILLFLWEHHLWAKAQELDLPVGLHVIGRKDFLGHEGYSEQLDLGTSLWYLQVTTNFFVQAALTHLFEGGVFERFPRLKGVVLEIGAGWLFY